MIEPPDRSLHRFDRRRVGRRRPAQHDHLYSECARGGDLAVARGAAAVFGDHGVNAVQDHERAVIGFGKWAARGQITDFRQRQRRVDGIDAADQIKMLRRVGQGAEFVATKRDKYTARPIPEYAHRRSDIGNFLPEIAADSAPSRPEKRQQRHAGLARGRAGICRNHLGIGMRRVDQRIDPLGEEIFRKTGGSAEAAAAHRRGLRRGRFGAAGERDHDFILDALGQPFCQFARFCRAAEDKDA